MRLIDHGDLAASMGRDSPADEVNDPIETTLIAHPGIWCNECSTRPIVGARYSKQLENDTYDSCKSCYDNLNESDQAQLSLVETAAQNVEADSTSSEDSSDNTTSTSEEEEETEEATKSIRERAEEAKLVAKASKEQVKRLVKKAHSEAKAAKQAEKAYKQAEKAAKKAAAQAEAEAKTALMLEAKAAKQAEKAEKQAAKQAKKAAKQAEKPNKHQIIRGKLVNWLDGDVAAVMGELSVLPSGHLCFNVDGRKGNLCVPPAKDLDGLKVRSAHGGCGAWAQFEAVVDKQKKQVFQLMSHPHRTTKASFLGVVSTEQEDAVLATAAGEKYNFTLVAHDSAGSKWSFYPEGKEQAFCPGAEPQLNKRNELKAQPDADPRQVYDTLQQIVNQTAEATQLPISLGDAPEDDAALVSMLNQLHQLLPDGIKKMAAKKLGLRKFEVPEVVTAEEDPSDEWELLMDELEEMGFEKSETTRQIVHATGGDLKQTVKQLVHASRNQ